MVVNYADGKRRFDFYATETDALDAAAVQRLEQAIDMHVFRQYGLTPKEITLVQDSARA